MGFTAFTACCYSALEYEKMSTRQRALALSLLTIIMLFLMSNSSTYFKSTDKSQLWFLHAGGFSGLTFSAAASTDGFIRSKFPDVRFFDEIAILASYATLWSLMALIFSKATYYFLVVCVSIVVLGFVLLRYFDLRNKHNNKTALSRIRDEQTRNFIVALSQSNSPAAAHALTTIALYAVITSPGEHTTTVLVEAATKAITPPAEAPDATAATADTDPGCCYGFFSA